MKKILFCSLVLWQAALPFSGKAQISPEAELRYQNAKQLLHQQKPAMAMSELLPLTNAGQPSAYQPSARYLYSVAANKAGKNKEAGAMLEQLFTANPSWDNIEEAYYLSAKIAFEQNDFSRALTALKQVNSGYIKPDAVVMKNHYLSKLQDKAKFQNLLNQFPEDPELGLAYANKLAAGWYTDQDQITLETIVKKLGLAHSLYNPSTFQARRKKAQYNVALLLPFALDNAALARKNQFVTDLYAGMKLAQDSLAKNNIKINLFAYNSGADTASVSKILQLPEITTMDLVVGPVYKTTARQAGSFAIRNKINVINPLSDDLEMVKNNPYLFLFESSVETRARKAADFAYDNFEPKTAAVIFENTKDDTLFARVYRSHFIARGGQVLLYKKINTKKNPNVMAIYSGTDLNNFGHLVMVSDNLPAAVATISQLESQNPKLPVLTKESWLEMPQLSLQQLDELEIHFISPKYIDPGSTGFQTFQRKYLKQQNIPPSSFAYSGFELIYYFGGLLQQYGPQFQTALPNNGPVSGVIYQGIHYGTAHDNQYVPIVKLESRQPEILNPLGR